MAKIELRHATIRLKDGLAGTCLVNDMAIAGGDVTLGVDNVALNGPLGTTTIPVGARFTFTADSTVTRTVTARTGTQPTTSITFTPALTMGLLPADNDTLTFKPIRLDIKVGEGNLTYTEAREMNYELDRGTLSTVREGDDQPLELNLEFIYEFVTMGTSETTTPIDALKRVGGAAEWTSASADLCEPYAVDVEIEHVPPCGSAQREITIFEDFRYEQLEFDLGEATIAVSGKCNRKKATVSRSSTAAP